MKKMLIGALLVGLMGVSAIAGTSVSGTVKGVKVYPNAVAIVIERSSDNAIYSRWINQGMSADAKKAMLATALSAQAQSQTVYISTYGGCATNPSDWCTLKTNP